MGSTFSKDTGIGRFSLVVIVTAGILFSLFMWYLLYRLCKVTLHTISLRHQKESSTRPVSEEQRRVANLLSRPGVRNILVNRVADVSLSPSGRETRARNSEDEDDDTPVVMSRVSFSLDNEPSTLAVPSPPPPYPADKSKKDELCESEDNLSIGPPPSYKSDMK